jgi:hypothetical protein
MTRIGLVLTVWLSAIPLASAQTTDSESPSVYQPLQLSGNVDIQTLFGQANSLAPEGGFGVDNARFFLDIDLARDVQAGETLLFDGINLFFEWDLIREASLKNKVGQLHVQFDNLLGWPGFDLRVGRLAIPFGEEYFRYSEQRPDNPLLGFSAPSPYGWDEGVSIHGVLSDGWVEYTAAVMDGDDAFNVNTAGGVTLVGRLTLSPSHWIRLSVGGIDTGPMGSPAETAFELGGTHGVPFGADTDLPNIQDGAEIDDDPDDGLDTLQAWEVDLVLAESGWGQLWLEYGRARIRSENTATLDRDLQYVIAELVVELAAVSDLDWLYLASRFSLIATDDPAEGYLLVGSNGGDDLGFNTQQVSVVTVGLGIRVTPDVVIKGEYSSVAFQTVDGLPENLSTLAQDRSYGGVGISLRW